MKSIERAGETKTVRKQKTHNLNGLNVMPANVKQRALKTRSNPTRRTVVTLGAALLALLLVLAPTVLRAVPRTWDGGGTNELASNPTNWDNNTAPVAGDAIILNATISKNMTWNMTNMTVASWTQIGYLGTVTIATVYGPSGFTNLNITGNCVISNGMWTHQANTGGAVENDRLCVTVSGNLIIGPNGIVDVTRKGYAADSFGPGAGGNGYGGSHGGRGHVWFGGPSKPCYGSIVAPTNLGSGGWQSVGGGAVLMTVAGTVRHDGLMAANGAPGVFNCADSSGGSIFLTAGALSGSGIIMANGYVNSGGGRIALALTNAGATFSGFNGAVSACAGGSDAGAGTVYLRTANQGVYEGTLIIDNSNIVSSIWATEITPSVTDTAVGNVIIRNGACLLLDTNQSLTVSGIWSNGAGFAGYLGSQVIFDGGASSTSIVYGSTIFMGLTCTNIGGKTILFEAGKTNTVSALGLLKLNGSATSTNLVLRSTIDGTAWKLKVSGAAIISVRNVDVKDSDALPGTSIGAFDSKDRGGNLNWVFAQAAQTNTWAGANSTVWGANNNWSLGHVPLAEEFVLIPSGCPRYPVLDSAKSLSGGLKIENNAALNLAGYNLTLNGNAVIAGSLTATNTETIMIIADADFTGSTVMAAYSTVVIGGTLNQTINPGNQNFYRINVMNQGGTIFFTDGFSATEFRCEADEGMRSFMFQQGATCTLRSLVLLGSLATPNILLRSSAIGQKWNLNVTGGSTVMGVDARDSDATGGKPIRATFSKDSFGNTNWLFEEKWSFWVGSNNASFHAAENWWPAGVPGPASRVSVQGTNVASITSPTTLLELLVGGSLAASEKLTVAQDLTIQANGMLMLSRPSTVKGDVYVLAGGTLTQLANPAVAVEVCKLNLTVGGNMDVDTNAVINVTGKGYAGGYGPAPGNNGWGGSYGGRGGGASGPCYGSIVAPTNLGSSGWSVAGGGAILLTVRGALRHNGLMAANGLPGTYSQGQSSGGTVSLKVGTLSGTGAIQATGLGNGGYSSGAGRIALVVTNAGAKFTGFTGAISAYGANYGGAGTIYKQTAADHPGYGTVSVINNNTVGMPYTDVPSFTNGVPGEVNRASFHLANGARLRLTNDFMLGDIWLDTANSVLDLGFKTLTVRSKQHTLNPGIVTNYGAIIWWPYVPKGTIYFAK